MFNVCVVSHVIKSLFNVFAPNKHVSFIFHKFNLCAQLILIIHGCSFCLPNFRTSSFTRVRCQKNNVKFKLVSLNVKGISNFKKGAQFTLGAAVEKPI